VHPAQSMGRLKDLAAQDRAIKQRAATYSVEIAVAIADGVRQEFSKLLRRVSIYCARSRGRAAGSITCFMVVRRVF
jgi:hypothetical protein